MSPIFEWDVKKAQTNLDKHKVSFQEAATVFRDAFARVLDDPDHSNGELREIIVGHSARDGLLVVSFAERTKGRIRIISARKADRRERSGYEENFQSEKEG